jgi:hypothetical protein
MKKCMECKDEVFPMAKRTGKPPVRYVNGYRRTDVQMTVPPKDIYTAIFSGQKPVNVKKDVAKQMMAQMKQK